MESPSPGWQVHCSLLKAVIEQYFSAFLIDIKGEVRHKAHPIVLAYNHPKVGVILVRVSIDHREKDRFAMILSL